MVTGFVPHACASVGAFARAAAALLATTLATATAARMDTTANSRRPPDAPGRLAGSTPLSMDPPSWVGEQGRARITTSIHEAAARQMVAPSLCRVGTRSPSYASLRQLAKTN